MKGFLNILSVASETQPTTQPLREQLDISPLMVWLICIGICVLTVWCIRRIAFTKTLRLDNAPLRINSLGAFHIILIVAVVLIPTFLANLLIHSFTEHKTRFLIAAGTVQNSVILAASLVCGATAFKGGLFRGMGFSARRWLADSLRAIVGYLAILPVCMVVLTATIFIITLFSAEPQELIQKHILLDVLQHETFFWKTVAFISAVIIAPFGEELFFRGIIQSMIRYKTRSPWKAILLTSLIFSLIHLPLWHTMPALFVLSCALGYNYERTGRLWAPIMIHMLFNAASMLSEMGF